MPRKRKPYSTRTTKAPVKKPEPEINELTIVDEPEEPAKPNPEPKPELLTVDQAIEDFKKNPRTERFFSPGVAMALAYGNHYLKFDWDFRANAGVFTTNDPVEVEILLRADDPGARYNVHFFAENPALRNIKR